MVDELVAVLEPAEDGDQLDGLDGVQDVTVPTDVVSVGTVMPRAGR